MNIAAGRLLRSPKAILFDLDGTLIDSAPDITAAVNELLAAKRARRGDDETPTSE